MNPPGPDAAPRATDALLAALAEIARAAAGTLEIREIFEKVSRIVGRVLPHDRLALGLLDEGRTEVLIHAFTGPPISGLPQRIRLTSEELHRREWDYEIVGDIGVELSPDSPRQQLLSKDGIRSFLRVPIFFEGQWQLAGGLVFMSRTPHLYRDEDVSAARFVADQVALLLAHQRLAEEERRSAAAREEAARLEAQVRSLTEELESRPGYGRIVAESKAWKDVMLQAAKVAPTDTTVLLLGESGTGKEVVARAIHRASPRAAGPFSAINCAALPEQLLESELFGYERGAFTGAVNPRPGRLELAAGGILFLDEVGETSPAVQAKLLRVLQEREFQRLGGARVLKADVRIVAATNRDLKQAIRRGEFREDLYYRLHVFEITLPPLRERREDILPLTEVFLAEVGPAIGRPVPGISREARELLLAYPWPGNVRELRNALERAAILCEGGLVTAAHLPISVSRGEVPLSPGPAAGISAASLPPSGVDLEAIEKAWVAAAIERSGGNKSRAARLLGLTRAQLYSRLEKYGL
ncbi:MAG TPA: sigma-54-dependent Fis family transcriptional regulator [Thermoanaerobaculia bacterium]|nr:sigma-54-dependent Fis family transcriptional regulator [Thermoanaerobaculia bacterium]HQR67207.1 sigma-54-dependent Fis family transcriptional regulator [Thermoanaerobaculia bacterium]